MGMIDLEQVIIGFDGKPMIRHELKRDKGGFLIPLIKDGEQLRNHKGEPIFETEQDIQTLGRLISTIVSIYEENDTTETKNRLDQIQEKLWTGKQVSLTPSQITLTIERANKFGDQVTRRRLKELLDPEGLKEEAESTEKEEKKEVPPAPPAENPQG